MRSGLGLESACDKKVGIAIADEPDGRADIADAFRCAVAIEEALQQAAVAVEIFKITKDMLADTATLETLIQKKYSTLYNLFEGFGNDAGAEIIFTELLEKLNIPFTGNSSDALRNCLNKSKTKQLLSAAGIITPRGFFIRQESDINAFLRERIPPPFFIKPCFEDASVGIDVHSLVTDRGEVRKHIVNKLQRFSGGIVVEEFIPGNEYNVALFGSDSSEIIGISLIDYSGYLQFLPFVTYDTKWETKSFEYRTITPRICTASELGRSLWNELVKVATKTCNVLGCESYTRVDIRQKGSSLYVIDVNPNPDLNVDSGFMRQAYSCGYRYRDMVIKIFSSAKALPSSFLTK